MVLPVGELCEDVAVAVVEHLDLSRVERRRHQLRIRDADVLLDREAHEVDGHHHAQRQSQQQ